MRSSESLRWHRPKVCLGYRCPRVGLRSRKTASTDASGSQVGERTNPAPRRTRQWGTVPAALRSAERLDLPPSRSRPPISRDASGFEPESLSRAGDQVWDGGEAAASVVVLGKRRPVFQFRSNDSKSATGPRCVSLSGLKNRADASDPPACDIEGVLAGKGGVEPDHRWEGERPFPGRFFERMRR